MKLFISDEQAERFHVQRWTDPAFNHKFDTDTGEELVSVFVPDICFHMFEDASKRSDAKGVIAYYACAWMGRVADLDRVIGCGVKLHDNGRIEIRLKFGPPWYWSHIVNATSRASRTQGEDKSARVDRAVSTI